MNFMHRVTYPWNRELIASLPKVRLHEHALSTIKPMRAWNIAKKHGLTERDPYTGLLRESLPAMSGFTRFSDLFRKTADGELPLDIGGYPIQSDHFALQYDLRRGDFDQFDRILAVIQGHRHPPGVIQTLDDLEEVLRAYLDRCLIDRCLYSELQINIGMSDALQGIGTPLDKRNAFLDTLKQLQDEYRGRVDFAFLHCFNKTAASGIGRTGEERGARAVDLLLHAHKRHPGLFVGMQSAGNERDESGWGDHLLPAYIEIRKAGLGAAAHAGEQIGVWHMLHTLLTLGCGVPLLHAEYRNEKDFHAALESEAKNILSAQNITSRLERLGHGCQAIEHPLALALVKKLGITLEVCPLMNLSLGMPIHRDENGKPHADGTPQRVHRIEDHPAYELMDKDVSITFSCDNESLGGGHLHEIYEALARGGLSFAQAAKSNLDGIRSSFAPADVRQRLEKATQEWLKMANSGSLAVQH